MITDPIADMLIRLKNAYLAGKEVVEIPYSKMKEDIAKVLVKEGYLRNLTISTNDSKIKIIKLELKYKNKKPAIEEVKQISKPGVRIYAKAKKIPRVKFGFGITIVSTPQGIMTDKEARKRNLGGEVICQIW